MSLTDEMDSSLSPSPAKVTFKELPASGGLNALFAKIDAGQVQVTSLDGFVPGLIKAALKRGLQAELSEHLCQESATLRLGCMRTPVTGSPRKRSRRRSAISSWMCPGTGVARSPLVWCPRVPGVLAGWMT